MSMFTGCRAPTTTVRLINSVDCNTGIAVHVDERVVVVAAVLVEHGDTHNARDSDGRGGSYFGCRGRTRTTAGSAAGYGLGSTITRSMSHGSVPPSRVVPTKPRMGGPLRGLPWRANKSCTNVRIND